MRLLLMCLGLIGALSLLGAGPSLAHSNPNCSGSAGDSQYVDPLACQTTSTSTPPPTTTTAPAPAQPAQTPTPSVDAATVTTAKTSAPDPHHAVLAFTGLDIWPVLALGVAFLGAGIALRRRAVAS